MTDAWHLDAHKGTLGRLPKPAELVSALFLTRGRKLVPGDQVRTGVGRFLVEATTSKPDESQVILSIKAPGSVSRVCVTVVPSASGRWDLVFHHSLHPNSWIGRVYFRLIQPFHHLLVEFALVWSRRRVMRQSGGLPGPGPR